MQSIAGEMMAHATRSASDSSSGADIATLSSLEAHALEKTLIKALAPLQAMDTWAGIAKRRALEAWVTVSPQPEE